VTISSESQVWFGRSGCSLSKTIAVLPWRHPGGNGEGDESALAEELIAALFWFHPALGWLRARIRLARELVGDAARRQ
jgi:hypothetical protein